MRARHGGMGAGRLGPAVIDPNIPVYALEKRVFDMWTEPGLRMNPFRLVGFE